MEDYKNLCDSSIDYNNNYTCTCTCTRVSSKRTNANNKKYINLFRLLFIYKYTGKHKFILNYCILIGSTVQLSV